ncbi:hypothetical protein MRS44_003085 [Fusarium solani]|jgi:hypothetical protein|uniref:uncharacterized protein n=1 Tax=Fusarium solani TaxID=169388 RepID=UPI0032C40E3D|nr:hypothetical protein MRS44_003085 [Fusarium solani]
MLLRRGSLTKQVPSLRDGRLTIHLDSPTMDLETASVPAPRGALATSIQQESSPLTLTLTLAVTGYGGLPDRNGMGWIPDSTEPIPCPSDHSPVPVTDRLDWLPVATENWNHNSRVV